MRHVGREESEVRYQCARLRRGRWEKVGFVAPRLAHPATFAAVAPTFCYAWVVISITANDRQ